MKWRAYIFVASAIVAGLFLDLVPMSLNASIIVGEGLFPVLFCCLLILLWQDSSLWQQILFLAGALVLGYLICEATIIFRNGARVLSDLGPGLILLPIRFGIALCALVTGYFVAKLLRRWHA